MGSIFSNPVDLTPEELTRLKAETGFTDDNIKRLFTRFQHLDKDGKGYLDKDDLMAIPEVCSQTSDILFVVKLLTFRRIKI